MLERDHQAEVRVELLNLPIEVPHHLFVYLRDVLIAFTHKRESSLDDDLVLEEILSEGDHSHVLWNFPVILVQRTLVGRFEGVDIADYDGLDELPLSHQERQVEQVEHKGVGRIDVEHDDPLLKLFPEIRPAPICLIG